MSFEMELIMLNRAREITYRYDQKVIITPKPMDVPEPSLTQNAVTLLERRYAKKVFKEDKIIAIETPGQIYWRAADFVSHGSRSWITEQERMQLARDYYHLMASGRFLPNTPTIANAGKDDNAQLAACFVLPIEDSMESIFGTLRDAALIHKTGGGTGFSFSRLRPKDSLVRTTNGVASGPISFMKLYNAMTEVVKQGGMRRGANMGMLRVDHPDILEFIECKSKAGEITNFNISVAVTEVFMQALETDAEYALIDPHTGQQTGTANARYVWDKIVVSAWQGGEPGLFFIDRANQSVSNPIIGWVIHSTNPCGEQPLEDYDACNLGSIKLCAFYIENDSLDWRDHFDWQSFRGTINLAVQFLDDVVTMSTYPLPQITETVDALRRIGLGPMGLSDLLQLLSIPYDSVQAEEVSREIAQFFKQQAITASRNLAAIRGAFPLFDQSIFAGIEPPRRNANITTVAPTGSLSRLTDCEGGIEPPFSLSYVHGVQKLHFVNNTAVRMLKKMGLWNQELERCIIETGSVAHADIAQHIKQVLKTSLEIEPQAHVTIQSIWQEHFSESGVSKTINLPPAATIQDVDSVFRLAYQKGCKGVTVYRYGSERASMMEIGTGNTADTKPSQKSQRPWQLNGSTFKIKTPYGNAYFTLNTDGEQNTFEGFIAIGKTGNEVAELSEGTMRLFSLIGRMPSSWSLKRRLTEIVEELSDIGGKKGLGPCDEKLVRSISDGIAFYCKKFLEQSSDNTPDTFAVSKKISGKFCPECQSLLIISEGCHGGKCPHCDYAAC